MNESDILPLLSNISDILVKHHIFHLCVHVEEKQCHGRQILFLQPTQTICNCSRTQEFQFVLEIHNINITNVLRVQTDGITNPVDSRDAEKYLQLDGVPLQFKQMSSHLIVSSPNAYCPHQFPPVIQIVTSTVTNPPAVCWRGSYIFNAAASTNNRSLLIGQDVPGAQSSWQAFVTAPSERMVLLTGDQVAYTVPTLFSVCKQISSKLLTWYAYSSKPVPLATVAMAVGMWCIDDVVKAKCDGCITGHLIPCRLLLPTNTTVADSYKRSLRHFLNGACQLLGPHPGPRVDIVLVPGGPDAIALTSPCMVLAASETVRCAPEILAHELAHLWWGVSVGQKRWEEEWISEGVCVWAEDYIAGYCDIHNTPWHFRRELRAAWRMRTLNVEMESTIAGLTVLCPTNVGSDSVVRTLSQVHRLKGYFLFRWLENRLGHSVVKNGISDAAQQWCGSPLDSTDLLGSIHKNWRAIEGISEWLYEAGIPAHLPPLAVPDSSNYLWEQVTTSVAKWKDILLTRCRKKRVMNLPLPLSLYPEQAVLILEELLDATESQRVSPKSLEAFRDWLITVEIADLHPEVWHRWAEMVCRHRHWGRIDDVTLFLETHTAMSLAVWAELGACTGRGKRTARKLLGTMKKQEHIGDEEEKRILPYL